MTTDDVHDAERRAAGLQQQIDKAPHEETARLLIDDVHKVAVLRDDPVGTPEQIVARIVGAAGGPAEQAAWVALQEELSNHTTARAIAGTLPDSRVVVLPGQEHAAMDTATDLFATEVHSFVKELP